MLDLLNSRQDATSKGGSEKLIIDRTTGALWRESFAKAFEKRLKAKPKGLLALISNEKMAHSSTDCDRAVQYLATQLREKFGNTLLIGRLGATMLTVFIELKDPEAQALETVISLEGFGTHSPKGSHLHIAAVRIPGDGSTANELYTACDLAMKQSIKRGEAVLFNETLRIAEARRNQLAKDMPKAIAHNEITPHFQPIIHSTTAKIKGFEALVRWTHRDHGYVSPPDIIELAQANGLLRSLTQHILQQTLAQMHHWPNDVYFSVNVTPSQITNEFIDFLHGQAQAAIIAPERLMIEITEDALIGDFATAAKVISHMRSLGYKIAMDDFGSGYTSIGNLCQLDFTAIKIDKVISDILPHSKKACAVVKALIRMADELKLDVTVEGIETDSQLNFLRKFECGVQGYIFSRPLPPQDMPAMRKFMPFEFEKELEMRKSA